MMAGYGVLWALLLCVVGQVHTRGWAGDADVGVGAGLEHHHDTEESLGWG